MLSVEGLVVAYGDIPVVRGLSLHADAGEIVSLVGPNGAGKSTTLLALAGVLPVRAGDVRFMGESIATCSPEARVRKGMFLIPEGGGVFGGLTVAENLRLASLAHGNGNGRASAVERALERFGKLRELAQRPARLLSGGERQQLAIARAMIVQPKLLLLDEPSLGLAPRLVDRVFELLDELRDGGTTVLVVEQNALRAVEAADRSYLVRSGGELVFSGTAADFERHADLHASYFGVRDAHD
ncbi:MAG TPA: ABC transporter ATP-binding protein [Conexibacter sp.]|nr:ABC transporter ATP-binding protein [Conexibacter sp.]